MNLVRRMFVLGAASLGTWVGAAESSSVPPVLSTGAPEAQLSYAPGQPPPSWAVAVAETLMARWPDYTLAYHGSWTYVHGYAFCAFERLHQSTGDRRYWDYIVRFIDRHIDEQGNFRVVEDGRGRKRETTFHNLDNMLPGNAVVMLYERTGAARYRRAADTIRRALDGYPRNRDGGLWHSTLMPGQMWIDGIFMGQMFLTRYGKSIGDGAWAWNEAAHQLLVYAQKGERGDSGLFVHGIYEPGHGERACKWADPATGLSPEVWSEGLGWYSLMLVETLAVLPVDHPRRREVEAVFRRHADGLRRTQNPSNGCWFQVVDKGERPDNWTDTSGSAMFVYALQRGIELGLIDEAIYGSVVMRGYEGIVSFAKINERGLVDIFQACDGLGVQVDYTRYVNRARVVNAREAVVGFLWATEIVERSRLGKFRARPTNEPSVSSSLL